MTAIVDFPNNNFFWTFSPFLSLKGITKNPLLSNVRYRI